MEFEIECRKAAGWAEQISRCSSEVKKQENRVEDVLSRLQSHKEDYCGLEQSLSGIAENLRMQREQIRQFGDALEHIARVYESAETDVLEKGAQELFRAADRR